MTQEKPSVVRRFRMWLAGWLFVAAGKLDETYNIWIDDAPSRSPEYCQRDEGHDEPCNGYWNHQADPPEGYWEAVNGGTWPA